MLVKQPYQLTNFRLKLFLLGTIPLDHSLKYDGKKRSRFMGNFQRSAIVSEVYADLKITRYDEKNDQ